MMRASFLAHLLHQAGNISKRSIHCGHCLHGQHSIVRPGKVSAIRSLPSHIKRPPYARSSWFSLIKEGSPPEIEIKSAKQIIALRDACKMAQDVLYEIETHIEPGVTTDQLDEIAHRLCIDRHVYPSPLLYKGFPKSICTSVNNVVCHGIPDDRPLEDGDIINVDVTVYHNGYHGDLSTTFAVGNVDDEALRLIDVNEDCRNWAIAICGPGVPFNTIGEAVQTIAEEAGYTVIPHFCGHGIGEYFHGKPDILHFRNDEPGVMKEGMAFTIEPILSEGDNDIEILSDGWTAITKDNSRTAQCEHTIVITSDGCEVLTE